MGRRILIIGLALVAVGGGLIGRELWQRKIDRIVPPGGTFGNPTGKPLPTNPDSYHESRVRISRAWSAYWYTGLPEAIELFKKEHDEHPNGYYHKGYTATIMRELLEYDKALKSLQGRILPSASQADLNDVYMEIYTLSKKFYDEYGIETEASGPNYGPEFFDAEEKVSSFEGPWANRLLRNWTHYDSCTDEGTAAKAEGQLAMFLDKFPDSSHKNRIVPLLEYYRSGSAICGRKKTVQ